MWLWCVIIGLVLVLISPLLLCQSSRLRYFACFASLSLMTFLASFVYMFVFLIKPEGCANIRKGRIAANIATKLVGLKFEGRDLEKTDIHEKFIAVANHQSFLDLIGVVREWKMLGNCVPVAKHALLYYWPFGLINWMVGTIFVDRRRKGAAYAHVLEQAKKHFNKYTGKRSILIFPEGARGDGTEFVSFREGAFKLAIDLNLPILPIVIAPFNFIKYLKYFKSGKFIYRVLDPISTAGYTIRDVEKLSYKTKEIMFAEYKKLMYEQLQK